MTKNTYVIDDLAKDGKTIDVTDDGTGRDWLVMNGVYLEDTDIRLSYSAESGVATAASGLYYLDGSGSRLVVHGVIENVRGSNGTDFIQGNELGNILYGDANRTGAGLSDTVWGAEGDDTIYGGAAGDELAGDNGSDRILGDAGADTIYGGAGTDTVEGGTGSDSLSGGADGQDVVSYAHAAGAVRVTLTFGSTTTAHGSEAEGDSLNGFNAVIGSDFGDVIKDSVLGEVAFGGNANTFFGGQGNDTLTLGGGADSGSGGADNDVIYGGQGQDTLNGGAGSDTLYGGQGDDTYIVDAASDVVIEDTPSGADGRDLVMSGVNWTLGARLEDLTLTGTATTGGGNNVDNKLTGNDVANTLRGQAGNDTLVGGAGDDTLLGGSGADALKGGAAADVFQFNSIFDSTTAAAGRDTIRDFIRADGDQIDLSRLDANGSAGGEGVFHLITTAFTGHAGELRVQATTGGVLLQGDTDGVSGADFAVFVANVSALHGGDIIL